MNPANLETAEHFQDLRLIVEKTRDALELASKEGTVRDYLAAIDQALKTHEYVGKEMVRRRVRPHVIEASNVLGGVYEGQEDVELGSWAVGCTEETINQRAEQVLVMNKGLY